jgi:UDP-N-acetylmuramoylalanine--D-glutamate ligase
MIPISIFDGARVAVFGLGGSGLATCIALEAGGAYVAAFDDDESKIAKAQANGFDVRDLRMLDWSRIAALVLSPGVPLTHPQPHWSAQLAHAAGVPVIGDIELFARERAVYAPGVPMVAITGTNGKSTTTALIAHLLRDAGIDVQMGGNIGTPILALEPFDANQAYVIECSSYQIDLAPSLAPTVGVLINLSEDHLDRHGSMAHYAEIKQRLVAGVAGDGAAIIGMDDDWCREIAGNVERLGKTVIRISAEHSLSDGIYAQGTQIVRARGGMATPIAELSGIGSLRGRHNAQNAACAVATALMLGLRTDAIQQSLVSFPGLAHRMEEVARRGDVLFVNDSKATNADSAARALACFDDIFWIAGGKPKTGGIAGLTEFFPRIRKAYLIGEAAADFADTLTGKVPAETAVTLDVATQMAARDAAASGARQPVVLLSPACASFDQFPNFEVRGERFKEIVAGLP